MGFEVVGLPDQVLEAEELEGLLYGELRRTPQAGEAFAAACRTVLARETKCEACFGSYVLIRQRLQGAFGCTRMQACQAAARAGPWLCAAASHDNLTDANFVVSHGRAVMQPVMSAGRRWAGWKGEGCKDFERREGGPLPALPLSPALREALPQRPNRIETGSEALNRRALSQHPFFF